MKNCKNGNYRLLKVFDDEENTDLWDKFLIANRKYLTLKQQL